jgi:hypothetical protein
MIIVYFAFFVSNPILKTYFILEIIFLLQNAQN